MFWDNFVYLCSQRNKAPSTVAKELQLSSGAATTWKNGAVPQSKTLSKIADYFGVAPGMLLSDDLRNEKAAPVNESGRSPLDMELFQLLCQVTPDEVQRVKDFIRGMIAAR